MTALDNKKALHIKIITPEKIVYDNLVLSITIPTKNGVITVLPDHIPMISVLGTGKMILREQDGQEIEPFALYKGVLEIKRNNEIIILTESTEPVSEIDQEKAQEGYDRAKKYLEEKRDVSDIEYARFQAMLEKNLNRLNILKQYRK